VVSFPPRPFYTEERGPSSQEDKNKETQGLDVSVEKQHQWEESEEALNLEVSEENGVKVEDESGETLALRI
jgi:hypothetical protein